MIIAIEPRFQLERDERGRAKRRKLAGHQVMRFAYADGRIEPTPGRIYRWRWVAALCVFFERYWRGC